MGGGGRDAVCAGGVAGVLKMGSEGCVAWGDALCPHSVMRAVEREGSPGARRELRS
jgi:hypothetical protein